MKLWLLSQGVHNGWDTYDSCVVAAETEEAARLILPSKWAKWGELRSWADKPEQVEVKYLGEAAPEMEAGVICASFNAG